MAHLTGKQVRDVLGISKAMFHKLVKDGELTGIRLGDGPLAPYRISEESLQSYIDRHRHQPAGKSAS